MRLFITAVKYNESPEQETWENRFYSKKTRQENIKIINPMIMLRY